MKHRVWLPVLFVLLVYLFAEGSCYLGLLVLDKGFHRAYQPLATSLSENQRRSLQSFLDARGARHVKQDPVLGWTNRSEVNAAGMRDDREYEPFPSPGMLRIAAFGDSFTFDAGVELHDSWAKQVAEIRPTLEVLNYGVGAYGLDQAYLRYLRHGTSYHPDVVFIGYMSENIARCVN